MNRIDSFLLLILIVTFSFVMVGCNSGGSVSDDFPLKVDNGVTNVTTTETNKAVSELEFFDYPVYDYGEHVVGSQTSYTFILKNKSSEVATGISAVTLEAPFQYKGGSFPGTGGSCGSSLAKDRQCGLIVDFIPTSATSYSSSLKVSYLSNGTTKIAKITINGEGTAADLELSGTGNVIGNTTINGTKNSLVKILNGGKYQASAIVASSLSSPFSFNGGTYPGTGGTCSATLSDSTSCVLDIAFDPTSSGVATQSLGINYYDGYETQDLTIDISGTAVNPAVLSFSETSFDFGVITKDDTTTLSVAINYSGASSATQVTTVSLGTPFSYYGGNFPGFGGNCFTTVNSDCVFVIEYSPADISEYSVPFTISYFNGATTDTITTLLVGKTDPSLELSDEDIDFGRCDISTNCQKSVTLNYLGYSGGLQIEGISATIAAGTEGFIFKGGVYPGTGGTCSTTLSYATGSCTMVFLFNKGYKGAYQDILNVNYTPSWGGVAGTSSEILSASLLAQTYSSTNDLQMGSYTDSTNSTGADFVSSIAVNETDKEIYLLGYSDGDLGGINQGGTDVFLLGLDEENNLLFRKTFPDLGTPIGNRTGNEISTAMIFNPSLNFIYFTGHTDADLSDSNDGSYDIFVSYFNKSGVHQGTTQMGVFAVGDFSGGDYSNAIAFDSTGDIYIGGKTDGIVEVGNTVSGFDAFLMKFTWDGTHIWTKMIGGNDGVTNTGHEEIRGIALNSSGDVIVAGTTTGSLVEANGGGADVFIAGFNSSTGAIRWIKQYGNTTLPTKSAGGDQVKGLVVDPRDYIYVVGNTTGNFDGNGNGGGEDLFILWTESDGTYKKTFQAGAMELGANGAGDEIVTGVSLDGYNALHITGYTTGGLSDGNNGGGTDIFSVKFDTLNENFYFLQWNGSGSLGDESMSLGNSSAVNRVSSSYFIAAHTNGDLTEGSGGNEDLFYAVRNYLHYGYTPIPRLLFSSSSLNYGSVSTVSSLAKQIKVSYLGDGELLTSVTAVIGNATDFNFTGGAYPGTSGTCTTYAFSHCYLDVTFTPTTTGALSTYVDIKYTVFGEGVERTERMTLTGTGI